MNQKPVTEKSLFDENNIYRFCGYGILIILPLVYIVSVLKWFTYSTFVFEAIMLFLFGTAWLIKGRALGDRGTIGRKRYREKNEVNSESKCE